MIELPIKDPCDLCVVGRDERWKIIDESEHTWAVINPWQFEVGSVVSSRGVMLRHCSNLPGKSVKTPGKSVKTVPGTHTPV